MEVSKLQLNKKATATIREVQRFIYEFQRRKNTLPSRVALYPGKYADLEKAVVSELIKKNAGSASKKEVRAPKEITIQGIQIHPHS
ncbi:hypothetical protein [Microbulbifer spongiae]|uniref:Uncharacterized protein n=1 Tax=Microbulbifer spongiae TaxID=2944933 RepID=A0ABY9EG92_9GAMM|nr:hypothetical protein [Microbulbifer sp. MI-G]WKD51702.1 hypothetical protein M8T91_18495 [Microbulbifer sp. MI-G]